MCYTFIDLQVAMETKIIEKTELLEGLNEEQKRAVTHDKGPLLIVAGAGTGKTTVITKRIAWLIETGRAKPEEILALTFTEKAAGEMEERVDQLLPMGYIEMWIQTFHAFCEKALRERAMDIGLPGNFRMLDQTAAWLLVREHLDELNLNYYRPLGSPSRFIHDLLKHFGRAKDELVTPEDYLVYAETVEDDDEKIRISELAKAYAAYEKLLIEEQALDFGSLITETIRLLKERPNVLKEFRARFKYVLVDEFQDTNFAQYELVRLLAGEGGNITVVGDDDQSIYKFRGASVSNILGFKDDHPESAQVFLTKNYRSCQGILDFSYAFIKQNDPNRLEFRLSGEGGLSKKMGAVREGKGAVTHILAPDLDDEARSVLDEIIRMKEEDDTLRWSDFAILSRAHTHASPCMAAMEDAGVPYLHVASKGLYLKPIIQDAISYLKLCDRYHESPALYRVLNWEVFAIPAVDVVELAHASRRHGQSLWKTLSEAEKHGFEGESLERLRHVSSLIDTHSERARKTRPSRLLKEIFIDSGYYKALLKDDDPVMLEAVRDLNQFVRRIRRYEDDEPYPTLTRFMQELDWEVESGEEGDIPVDLDQGPDTVKVMTIHKSKGLEFRAVFIVQMVAARFPGANRSDAIPYPDALVKETLSEEGNPHIEEERRLFYVAATRAKDCLYMTSAQDTGGSRKKKVSKFIEEAGEIKEANDLMNRVVREDATLDLIGLETPKIDAKPAGLPFALPETFSFSQLAAYENCPLQYKFAHLLKIPTGDSTSMQFGKTVHAVLEEMMKSYAPDKGLKPLEDFLALYDELWKGEWYESEVDRDRHYASGKAAIRHVWKMTAEEKPRTWLQEAPFTIKLDGKIIKGKIDRVDLTPDDKAIIYDYKTSAKAKDPSTIQKEQLRIYQMAVADVYGKETESMHFWYVVPGERRDVKVSEKDLEKTREKLLKRIDGIESANFEAKPDKFTCQFCDFKDICQKRKL